MGRRLRCSGKPWRMVKSACMYQPRHRTHVPSGIGWYIDASRWTAITSRSASRSSRANSSRVRSPERREQSDQLCLAVEAHAAVAYDMRERGDALDVIADVGRCAGRTRMPVVHDREHRALAAGAGAVGESASAATHDRIQSRCIGPSDQPGTSRLTCWSKTSKTRRARSWAPYPKTAARISYQLSARMSGGSSSTSARTACNVSSGARARPDRTYSAGASRAQVTGGTSRRCAHASAM